MRSFVLATLFLTGHVAFAFSGSRSVLRQRRSRTVAAVTVTAAAKPEHALLFDCDGVIVETEELHRLAYNGAFEAFELEAGGAKVEWDVPYYDKLQNTVGGGKPKMRYYFTETLQGAWPAGADDEAARTTLIDNLQDKKTEIYKKIVKEVASARPGVLALMDAAIARPDVYVGICSAATRAGFETVVDSAVGQPRLAQLDCIIAGDDVDKKKPDPMIYNVAAERLGLSQASCVVIEDSLVGLRAAKGAGAKCVITYTGSTSGEDFYAEGADAKLLDLSDVTLDMLFGPAGATAIPAELLDGVRDPK